MPTVSLTAREYNELRVRDALAAHRATAPRHTNPQNGGGDEGACRGIAGRPGPPLADPPPERKFEMGLYDAPTRSGARRGGRPRRYASKQVAQAAAARAYRVRQLALRLGPHPENGGRS
jgi:hypothetical protein